MTRVDRIHVVADLLMVASPADTGRAADDPVAVAGALAPSPHDLANRRG
jgi:hypothetical protein